MRRLLSSASFAGLAASALLITCPKHAYPCSITLPQVRVSSSFRVLVEHGTSPVPHIRVAVYDYAELERSHGEGEWKPMLSTASDENGAVQLTNLAPGKYLVETKGAGAGSAVDVVVSHKLGKRRKELTLEWPFAWRPILKVRQLAGRLNSNEPSMPFENVHVELWTAGAETPLSVHETGGEGNFFFGEEKPGIYILRIRGQQKIVGPDWQVEGDIPIELSSSSQDAPSFISLDLAMTSCGITYSTCLVPEVLELSSRRIRLIDANGAVIAKATYLLLDPAGSVRAQGSTDSDGMADLPATLTGRMTLVVASVGFTKLKQPLDLRAPEGGASELRISMTVHGSDKCTSASLEKHATSE